MIMAHGRLWAVGNALSLKQREGSGYRLNLSASPSIAPMLASAIVRRLATAQIPESDAGSVTAVIPFSSVGQLPALLQWIEQYVQQDGEK